MNAEEKAIEVERRLRRMEDRQEIHDALMRYCRGVDRGDPELILSAFHEDATDNHFGIPLPPREAIGSLRNPPSGPMQCHNICNEFVDIQGGFATSESYFIMISRMQYGGGEIDWVLNGRYVDRFERRVGSWRIARRTVIYDLERLDPVDAEPEGLGVAKYLAEAVRGMRGRGDWSYTEFREFDSQM